MGGGFLDNLMPFGIYEPIGMQARVNGGASWPRPPEIDPYMFREPDYISPYSRSGRPQRSRSTSETPTSTPRVRPAQKAAGPAARNPGKPKVRKIPVQDGSSDPPSQSRVSRSPLNAPPHSGSRFPAPPSRKTYRPVDVNAAATRIQAMYRGHCVRRSEPRRHLRLIAKVRSELKELVERAVEPEQYAKLCKDPTEQLKWTEGLMALLLRLDSLQGVHPHVRDIRKSVAREIIHFQNLVDSATECGMQDAEEQASPSECHDGLESEDAGDNAVDQRDDSLEEDSKSLPSSNMGHNRVDALAESNGVTDQEFQPSAGQQCMEEMDAFEGSEKVQIRCPSSPFNITPPDAEKISGSRGNQGNDSNGVGVLSSPMTIVVGDVDGDAASGDGSVAGTGSSDALKNIFSEDNSGTPSCTKVESADVISPKSSALKNLFPDVSNLGVTGSNKERSKDFVLSNPEVNHPVAGMDEVMEEVDIVEPESGTEKPNGGEAMEMEDCILGDPSMGVAATEDLEGDNDGSFEVHDYECEAKHQEINEHVSKMETRSDSTDGTMGKQMDAKAATLFQIAQATQKIEGDSAENVVNKVNVTSKTDDIEEGACVRGESDHSEEEKGELENEPLIEAVPVPINDHKMMEGKEAELSASEPAGEHDRGLEREEIPIEDNAGNYFVVSPACPDGEVAKTEEERTKGDCARGIVAMSGGCTPIESLSLIPPNHNYLQVSQLDPSSSGHETLADRTLIQQLLEENRKLKTVIGEVLQWGKQQNDIIHNLATRIEQLEAKVSDGNLVTNISGNGKKRSKNTGMLTNDDAVAPTGEPPDDVHRLSGHGRAGRWDGRERFYYLDDERWPSSEESEEFF